MEPCIDIPIDEDVLQDLVEKAKDYCLMHGEYRTVGQMWKNCAKKINKGYFFLREINFTIFFLLQKLFLKKKIFFTSRPAVPLEKKEKNK